MTAARLALVVDGLHASYGDTPVLHGVSLAVRPGERVALVGRNGAGKTTLLSTLMGLVRARAGTVRVDAEDVTSAPPHAVARAGLALVPQGRRLFPGLSVEENLRLAAHSRRRWQAGLADELYAYFPVLAERRRQRAGSLSGGEQQMAAIARALAGDPRVLLLDEPSEGLSPVVVEGLAETLATVAREREVGLLLVEQNVEFAARLAERWLLMEKGRLIEERVEDLERIREFVSI